MRSLPVSSQGARLLQLTTSARVALSFALAAVFAWLFLLIWRRDRTQPALAWWAAAHVAWALSMPVFALRGLVPDWIPILLGNAAVCFGYGLLWGGTRRFSGLSVHAPGLLAGAAAWGIFCLLPGFLTSLPERVALGSTIITLYSLANAQAFRQGMRRHRLPSHRAAVGVLIAHGVTYAARAGLAFLLPFHSHGGEAPAAMWDDIIAIIGVALLASHAVLLVALAGERSALATEAVLTRARDTATAASREKSRFLARMSHELRTPLNGVFGMAQVLARDPTLSAHQREQAETLEQAGRHLLAIVNDVLDLTRIEAGRLELAPRPVPLRDLLREALDLVRGAAAEKRIDLVPDLAPDLPGTLLADPVRLRQILLNLLGNAVKFTPPGGAVTLEARCLPEGGLSLAVLDTGPGVPAELRENLFVEFTQARQESEAGRGTGLGLAISAALARAMDGRLDYCPGPEGRGSRFTASLPLPAAGPAAPAPIPAPLVLSPRDGLRILVVDDAAANRRIARAMLEQDGHAVLEAADGSQALAALRAGARPDLVLMDIGMPGLDGYATTGLIRALPGPMGRVPVVALTAYAMPEDGAAIRAAGMDGHLTKPIDRVVLRAELARLTPAGAD